MDDNLEHHNCVPLHTCSNLPLLRNSTLPPHLLHPSTLYQPPLTPGSTFPHSTCSTFFMTLRKLPPATRATSGSVHPSCSSCSSRAGYLDTSSSPRGVLGVGEVGGQGILIRVVRVMLLFIEVWPCCCCFIIVSVTDGTNTLPSSSQIPTVIAN